MILVFEILSHVACKIFTGYQPCQLVTYYMNMKQATYIKFSNTTTMDTAPDYVDSLINEATEIMFNPKNFNRDGVSISFSPGTW